MRRLKQLASKSFEVAEVTINLIAILALSSVIAFTAFGCGGIVRGADTKTPDTAMRIEKVDGKALHVSYINEQGERVRFGEMIHFNGQIEGWTLIKPTNQVANTRRSYDD